MVDPSTFLKNGTANETTEPENTDISREERKETMKKDKFKKVQYEYVMSDGDVFDLSKWSDSNQTDLITTSSTNSYTNMIFFQAKGQKQVILV